MNKSIKFKKGDSATLDDLEFIFRFLPLGVRNHKDFNKSNYDTRHMEDDLMTESYFEKSCEVIIKWKD